MFLATGSKPMIVKVLVAAVAAFSLASAGAANAYHHKRHKHRAPAFAYVAPAPMVSSGPRPVWAAPGSCYTDEGYGRYRPCDAGPSNGR
jgi:hypothetical protein